MAKISKPKLIIGFLIVSSLIFIRVIYRQLNPTPNTSLPTTSVQLGNKTYQIEIAKTNQQRSVGLSNRKNLCPTCGMIFIFGNESTYPFWMKDTLIPLDMIWINRDGIIVDVQTATPQPNVNLTQLTIYQNKIPATYVLELNAGDSAKLNLKIGHKIDLSSLKI